MSNKIRFFQRYFFIIDLLNRRKLNVQELVDQIAENFKDYSSSYSSRTLSRDLSDIKEIFGFEISFNRSGKYYEIEKGFHDDEDQKKHKLLESLQLFQLASNHNQYKDILVFEQRKFEGFHYIADILTAIRDSKIITFNYQKFNEEVSSTRTVRPLAIREHNSRWYMVAEEVADAEKTRKSFGLDRIIGPIVCTDATFEYPTDFDIKTHLDHVFGLGDGSSQNIEKVQLLFNPITAKYIKTLPLHKSQQEIVNTKYKDGVLMEYQLVINRELVHEIVKLGAEVKVIQPTSLKNKVKEVLQNALKQYQ
ncbi:WYL domain-containing protein [Flavobacterium agricola]|uniref:WYL domain-containing protein n=1 Tax=Flavobacterium agricola TaxID=2870839 RepID=A0ABY6LYD2_9FLAO|nr:WYL domain-containing protein [Flavobacterium agricola]UYW00552.1 WYL domain-containing protein [Flavobacterium agricola]